MHFGPTIVYSLSSFSCFTCLLSLDLVKPLPWHKQQALISEWPARSSSGHFVMEAKMLSQSRSWSCWYFFANKGTYCNTSSRLWFQNGLQTNFQAILWCIQKCLQNLDPDYVGISLRTVLCKIPMFLLRFRGESF